MVLAVSKIKRDKFRFTGRDIERCLDGLVWVYMNEYPKSMEELTNIKKDERTEKLHHAEMKEYIRFTGKMSCLA